MSSFEKRNDSSYTFELINLRFIALYRLNRENDGMEKIMQNYADQTALSRTIEVQYPFFSYSLSFHSMKVITCSLDSFKIKVKVI